jgi:hypothetical protein
MPAMPRPHGPGREIIQSEVQQYSTEVVREKERAPEKSGAQSAVCAVFRLTGGDGGDLPVGSISDIASCWPTLPRSPKVGFRIGL